MEVEADRATVRYVAARRNRLDLTDLTWIGLCKVRMARDSHGSALAGVAPEVSLPCRLDNLGLSGLGLVTPL